MRHAASDLRALATAMLERGGLPEPRARTVARILIEAELLGRTTHGLQLLPRYLDELASGAMAADGHPTDLTTHPAALLWDAGRLPGPWILATAIERLMERSASHPVITASIRRAHHTACLGAQLLPVAEAGLIGLLCTCDPVNTTVAPPGGLAGRISGNPIAACVPTEGDPILIDFSLAVSFGQIHRHRAAGTALPGRWLIDGTGEPSDDPAVLAQEPRGVLLPLGGLDMGHKGFGLGLLIDLLCSGLAGHGRADAPAGWQANVFIALVNPGFFAGGAALRREAAFVAAACRDTPVLRPDKPVRMPGDAAFAGRRRRLAKGIALEPSVLDAVKERADRLGLAMPAVMAD